MADSPGGPSVEDVAHRIDEIQNMQERMEERFDAQLDQRILAHLQSVMSSFQVIANSIFLCGDVGFVCLSVCRYQFYVFNLFGKSLILVIVSCYLRIVMPT